jgi:hypothetical protein
MELKNLLGKLVGREFNKKVEAFKPITAEEAQKIRDEVGHVPAENWYGQDHPFEPQRPFHSFRGVKSLSSSRYNEELNFMREEQEERERLAREHAKQLLLIKQDNALDLIKRHCLACRGYIGNSLLPPRIELTRRNAEGTAPETARIAIACPVCGYVMMFDVELSTSEMLLPVPAPEPF